MSIFLFNIPVNPKRYRAGSKILLICYHTGSKPERRVEGQYTSENTGSYLSPESSWGGDGRGDVTRVIGLDRAKKRGWACTPALSKQGHWAHARKWGLQSTYTFLSMAKPSRIYRGTSRKQSNSSVFLSLFIQFVCYFAPRLALLPTLFFICFICAWYRIIQ